MSLISDALKTAQRQRASRDTPLPQVPILGGFFPAPPRTRGTTTRWRGAAAGGAIGLLLLVGAFGVREWKAMHAPVLKLGPLPLPRVEQPPARQQPSAAPHATSAAPNAPATAAQQGEQIAAPRQTVAQTPNQTPKPGDAGARSSVATQHVPPAGTGAVAGSPTAPRVVAPSPVAPATVAPAATSAGVPTQAAAGKTGALRVNVQGGAQDMSDRLLQQARDAQRQGNVDAAEDVYRRAVATHQADAEIYNNYAALLADRGDSARAITMYKLAIGLDPTYVDAWSNLGMLFDAMGDHRQATGVYQQVLKLDSTNVAARNGLAEQYQALGDLTSARRLFEQVTRSAPDFARAHYELAVLLDGQSDTTGAVREYGLFLQTARGKYPQLYEDRVRARIAALSGGKKP